MLDYIIVGQGIAGSMLSWFLLQRGKSILVIDSFNSSSSTNIASGISKPITGRRFVKTWMADELFSFSAKTYTELERYLDVRFFYQVPVYKLFDSIKAQNDWSARCATPEYMPYLANTTVQYLDKQKVSNPFGCFEINGTTRLEMRLFSATYRGYLLRQQLLIDEWFDMAQLQLTANAVVYKQYEGRKIIFCEGAADAVNTYFPQLPFLPAKGECLLINASGFYNDRIINGDVIIMPYALPDTYYVGATHQWNYKNALPSTEGRQELLAGLDAIIKVPYQIIEHKAAIRPTVKDRRPFIGSHPKHAQIGIFNGLGTKGVSLAPYFANHFVQHLEGALPLLAEVDVRRFFN